MTPLFDPPASGPESMGTEGESAPTSPAESQQLRRAVYVNVTGLVRPYNIDLDRLRCEMEKEEKKKQTSDEKGKENEGAEMLMKGGGNDVEAVALSGSKVGHSQNNLYGNNGSEAHKSTHHSKSSYQSRLQPPKGGFNLCLLVGNVNVTVDKLRVDRSRVRVAEVEVGDETGSVLLRARDDQIDVLQQISEKSGAVVLRNATLELYQGRLLRLAVTKWGKLVEYPDRIASTPQPPTQINTDFKYSEVDLNLIVPEVTEPLTKPSSPREHAGLSSRRPHSPAKQSQRGAQSGLNDIGSRRSSSQGHTRRRKGGRDRKQQHFVSQGHGNYGGQQQYRYDGGASDPMSPQVFPPLSPYSAYSSQGVASISPYEFLPPSPFDGRDERPQQPYRQQEMYHREQHQRRQEQLFQQQYELQRQHMQQVQLYQEQQERLRLLLRQQQPPHHSQHPTPVLVPDLQRRDSHESSEHSLPFLMESTHIQAPFVPPSIQSLPPYRQSQQQIHQASTIGVDRTPNTTPDGTQITSLHYEQAPFDGVSQQDLNDTVEKRPQTQRYGDRK